MTDLVRTEPSDALLAGDRLAREVGNAETVILVTVDREDEVGRIAELPAEDVDEMLRLADREVADREHQLLEHDPHAPALAVVAHDVDAIPVGRALGDLAKAARAEVVLVPLLVHAASIRRETQYWGVSLQRCTDAIGAGSSGGESRRDARAGNRAHR